MIIKKKKNMKRELIIKRKKNLHLKRNVTKSKTEKELHIYTNLIMQYLPKDFKLIKILIEKKNKTFFLLYSEG